MSKRVAIVGATGAVGAEMISALIRRKFPVGEVRLLASERSAGKKLDFGGKQIVVEALREDAIPDVDIALFSAGGAISKKFAPLFAAKGCVVIDNSSAWRMDPDVPLVVPEVTPHDVQKHNGIIANPNCSTIQMVHVLKPIYDEAGIVRIVVATYQSVSGAGWSAIMELESQTRDVLDGIAARPRKFPHRIAFNCIPHIGAFLDNGYTDEEMKMVHETRKILGDKKIMVSATTVRVPVVRGHGESVNVQTARKITAARARQILAATPNIVVLDDPANAQYPLQTICRDDDRTFVGRIREDISTDRGLDMWIVADNLLKGAATNAVQIAELLL